MRSSQVRAAALLLAAACAAVVLSDPPGASAHPGDLVLSKPAGGGPAVGAFATPGDPQAAIGRERATASAGTRPGAAGATATAPPAARRIVPHHFTRPGSRPAPVIGSRAKAERGHVDVTTRARELAARRASLGPAANRRDVTTSEPGQDLVRIALLRVDFRNDREGGRSSGDGRFELVPRDTVNRPLDPTPHNRAFWQSHGEAIARYWDAQSNGRTVVETVVYPSGGDSAFHLSDMADYGPWKFSPEIYEAALKLFHDCVNAADTTESIPWSTFDRVLIVHAGSDLQSDVNQDSPLDIPTFTIGVPDSDAVVVGPARADTIFGAAILPESIRQDGYEGVVNAVIAHELGHLIYGYRDVYDVVSGLPTVGYWDLMDVGNLLGNPITFPSGTAVYATGILPPSVDPWQKRLIYPDVPVARFPNYGQEEPLGNSSEYHEVLQVPLSGEEYLLLENRLDDLNGNGVLTLERDPATGVILGPGAEDPLEYDYLVPGPGILAWQVDESVADYFGPRADPGFGLNVNRGRFGLEVVEADGLDDLGDFNSPFALGVPSDTWKAGPNSRLNFDTVPRLRTNSRTNPHLDLEFTSAPGSEMTLRVTRLWDLPGWPVRVTQPEEGISPVVGSFGDDPNPRVVWSDRAAIRVRELDGSVPGAWPNDVAFSSAAELGPVTIVPHAGGGGVLAVAVKSSGQLYTVDRILSGTTVRSVVFPSPITAGPTTSNSATDRLLVGLADGRVCEYRTDTETVRDLFDTGEGAVTGIAQAGVWVAAASRSGVLVAGMFEGGDPGDPFTLFPDDPELPADRDLQPILLPRVVAMQVVVVDRTKGSARTFGLLDQDGQLDEPWQGRELGEPVGPPAVADLDGDGQPEIAFITASGRVGYWNLNGSTSPGWPPELEREGFVSGAGPLPFTHPSLSPDPLLFAMLGNGVAPALDRKAKNVDGFPLGFSVGARGTPAFGPGPVGPILYAAGGDTLLYGILLGGPPAVEVSAPSGGASGTYGSAWTAMGGGPTRSYADPTIYPPPNGGGAPASIVDGSLVCYPNPARREPITFAFRLEAPGPITISVYDASARLVEKIERDGTASDNAITWDPAGRTSGLYVARIEAGGTVVTQPFALVR